MPVCVDLYARLSRPCMAVCVFSRSVHDSLNVWVRDVSRVVAAVTTLEICLQWAQELMLQWEVACVTMVWVHLEFLFTMVVRMVVWATTRAPRRSAQRDAHRRASARALLWHMGLGAAGGMRLASGWLSPMEDATASIKHMHPVQNNIRVYTQHTSSSVQRHTASA